MILLVQLRQYTLLIYQLNILLTYLSVMVQEFVNLLGI